MIISLDDVKLFILLFADDAVLFAHTPEALQSLLNDLHRYCNIWKLKVNTGKTKIMMFESGRHTSHDFIFYNAVLEVVSSFKYLGIWLFKNGHFNRKQKKIAQQSMFALHSLFIVFNQLDLSMQDKIKLQYSITLSDPS